MRREVKATVLGGPWRSVRSLQTTVLQFRGPNIDWWFGPFELILTQVTHTGFSTAGLSGPKCGSTRMKKLLYWVRRVHSLWSAGGQGWAESVL